MTIVDGRWSPARARAWDRARGWRVGCNFTPSTASNPLEMWQAESFDAATIERELGWASDLGFTSVRVFLHDLLWTRDRAGFLVRLERFLSIANRYRIGTLVVLFDAVWDPDPVWGRQAEPRAGVHNSRWVQSPGATILGDRERHAELADYVRGLLDRFRDDSRIDGWDLFNEPDNPNPAYADREIEKKGEFALALLRKAFRWGREVAPSQPLTAGLWNGQWHDVAARSELDRFCLEHSDILSFHHYGKLASLENRVEALQVHGRPIWCTEWLARGLGSDFDPHLRWMKDHGIGAYCWGLVAGRTQTHLPWESWVECMASEPDPWHHDILRENGTPYDADERAFIRSLTSEIRKRR